MKRLILSLIFFSLATTATAQDLRYVTLQTSPFSHQTSGFSTFEFNSVPGAATTDWIEWCTQAQEAATITTLSVYLSSESGTGPTYIAAMEGMSTSTGEADGSVMSGTGACSGTIVTDGQSAGWKDITLTGTTCALTRGQKFCITLKHSSGTNNATHKASFAYAASAGFADGTDRHTVQNEYAVTASNQNNTAGLGTKQQESPIFMYKSSSRIYGKPWVSAGTTGYSSDSNPDENGNRFIFNCPSGMQYKLAGIKWHGQTASASKSVIVSLYDDETSPTALQTVTWDADNEIASAGSNRTFEQYFDETTLESLDCGADYVIALAVQETSSNFGLRYFDVGANGDFDAYPGGIETYAVGRQNATGNFSATNTRRYMIDLIIDDIVDPAAGGGVTSNGTGGNLQ